MDKIVAAIFLYTFSSMTLAVGAAFQISKGNIKNGAAALLSGMAFTDLCTRIQGVSTSLRRNLMKSTFGIGMGLGGIQGAIRLVNGLRQKSVPEIAKGVTQSAAGFLGAALAYSIKPRTFEALYQGSLLGGCGVILAKEAISDFSRRSHKSAIMKMVMTAGCLAGGGYLIYNASNPSFACIGPLSEKQADFLETYKEEIDELYNSKPQTLNRWIKIAQGVSKQVYVHEDLPGTVIKFPARRLYGYRGKTRDDDLVLHHRYLEEARVIGAQYDRIVIPACTICQTSTGKILLEEKLEFDRSPFEYPTASTEPAYKQFHSFVNAVGLCDISVTKNADFLKESNPPRIGFYDFDCKVNEK